MNTYTLKVVEKRKETDDVVTLCFKQPGLKKIKYLAGQYLTLIFRVNERRYIRPYSFSSCPGVDELLEITVKRVVNGIISNHICDIVAEGDIIQVMPPMGDFVYKEDKGFNSIYLWGVGSGITPLISITKYILFTEPTVKVHLIYGNRSHESTIFLQQIQELQKQYQHSFYVKHFYTILVVDDDNPNIIQGRIDQTKALSILEQDHDLAMSAHYICGPTGLKESVKKALAIRNINPNHIFSEDFELIKDPKDFDNVFTQKMQLRFQEQTYQLEVIKGKSILEAALDADIELPYSCQTGNCSTCKGMLISGMAKMIGLSEERSDLVKNEYLLCCSYPLNNNVLIEI
ncbi:FAD-binding oxidoreductase [Pedobacter sp. PWIIR3]